MKSPKVAKSPARKRKIRIAIFTDAFFPYLSGVVTALTNLAKGMADRGHKVFIFAPKYKGEEVFKYKNITVIRYPAIKADRMYDNFRISIPVNLRVLRTILEERIDVIHFHTPGTVGMDAVWIAKVLKIPLVGTFHTFISDPTYLSYLNLNTVNSERFAWDYSNLFYNSCDLITSPSSRTKKEMMKNRCKRPVKVISNGIDVSIFDNSKAAKLKEQHNPRGRLLLFVGRMGIEKNVSYLLDCFKLASKKVPSAKLLMVGDGPYLNEFKEYSKKIGLVDKVIFTGSIDHKELVKSGIFGACEIFVSASLTENQPVTVLEAQANGMVCVVIDALGMSDLVKNELNGFLVPKNNKKAFAEAIVRLLEDKKLYARLKAGTLREIQKHKTQKVIDEWEKTYSELVAKRTGRNRPIPHRLARSRKILKELLNGKRQLLPLRFDRE